MPPSERRFNVEEVARWAFRRFNADVSDLPIRSRIQSVKVTEGVSISGNADLRVLPGAIPACHDLINALWAERDALLKQIASASETRKRELASRFKRKPK